MADDNRVGYGFADDPDPPQPERPARPPQRADDPRPKAAKPLRKRPNEDDEPPARPAPTPPKEMKKSDVIGLTLMITALLGVAVGAALWQRNGNSAETAAFAADMTRLMAPPAAGPAKPSPGKVAILDIATREPHYLHRSMASDLRARTPQEAVAIVQLRVTDREFGEYLNGRKSVQRTYHMTVIDKSTWAKIDERSFACGDPPDSIRLKGGDRSPVAGETPSEEMYAHLRALFGG